MKKVIIGILVLLVFLAMPTASAESSEYYLVPEDSGVPEFCNTVEVELWLNATVPVAGGFVGINYTYCCANILDYSPNKEFFEEESHFLKNGRMTILFSHWVDGWALTNQPAGLYHLGNLTIHCCNETSDCRTDLLFADCKLYESVSYEASPLPFVTTNGTFTCGTPPCLGDCYNDTGALVASDVPCYECIGTIGVSWENYPCPAGDCGCTCPRMAHETCPECCDGIDNDGVNGKDWPNDPKCGCCIDPDEKDGTDPCPPPCVPELPTLALAGIGILGAILLARKRE